MKILFLFLLFIITGYAAPWFEILFGKQQDYTYQPLSYKNQQSKRRQEKRGEERWKEICRMINPDPYAFPDRVPYPSVPICP